MLTIFIRTLIIYFILVGVMRIMGKRQIGELEVSELITTLLLSEIAALPIENQDIPVIFAVIPIVTLLSFEVITSMLLTKSQNLKAFFAGKPSMLINNGVLDQKELKKNRISMDELLSELRQKDFLDISEIKYAILEQNGKISAVPKASCQPPTRKDMQLKINDAGIAHPVIIDGFINKYNLSISGKDEKWLGEQLDSHNCPLKEVFLLTVDDVGKTNFIQKIK